MDVVSVDVTGATEAMKQLVMAAVAYTHHPFVQDMATQDENVFGVMSARAQALIEAAMGYGLLSATGGGAGDG